MNLLEQTARAICKEDGYFSDPDQIEDGQPAWKIYLPQAVSALEVVASWIQPQRNDVPAIGEEFAGAIRYEIQGR